MELGFDGHLADRAYPILASLVVPRPIALVTTTSPAGKVSAAPKRVNSNRLFLIGRLASPHWYCRTRDRFELIRPE